MAQIPSSISKTCALGGANWEYNYLNPFDASHSVAHYRFAGNEADTTDQRLVDCCGPFPVHFSGPCSLWCEKDPTVDTHSFVDCLYSKGIRLGVVETSPGPRPFWERRMPKGAVAGAFLLVAFVVGVVLVLLVRLVVRRRLQRTERALWQAKLAEAIAVAGPQVLEEKTAAP
jgi:hypothetical protein